MKTTAFLFAIAILFIFAAPQLRADDYTYTTSGGTFNNSFSAMMDMTRTWNTNLWNAQSAVNQVDRQTARIVQQQNGTVAPPPQAPAPPPLPQFPITATDFIPIGPRILPDQIVNTTPNLTGEQKDGLKQLSNQYLDAFESQARKNNVANALAFLVGVSLQTISGKEPPDVLVDQLITGFNNGMANTAQFEVMNQHDKQVLYESFVISGGMVAFLHQQKDAQMQKQARDMARAVVSHFLGIQVPN